MQREFPTLVLPRPVETILTTQQEKCCHIGKIFFKRLIYLLPNGEFHSPTANADEMQRTAIFTSIPIYHN